MLSLLFQVFLTNTASHFEGGTMLKTTKNSLVLMLIALLLLAPLGTAVTAAEKSLREGEEKSGKMVADLLLVRPAGIVATILGGAVFILGSPFSALGGNIKETYEQLLVAPARYTFVRPLGDI